MSKRKNNKQSNDSEWYYETVRIPVRVCVNSRSFKKKESIFGMVKYSLAKLTALILIISLNWSGLSAVIETFASFSDTEGSFGNVFQAGVLDFELQSLADFPEVCFNEPTKRTISIVNYGNPFKYVASSTEFSGEICDYVTLEANVDGGDPEYVGSLTAFNHGPLEFSDPDDWVFKTIFNPDLPDSLLGQTCAFKFVFDGSQIKNYLPFGQGFNDTEEIINNITVKPCYKNCKLELTKIADVSQITAGDVITYHLTFDNVGGKVCTGGGVRLRDTFGNLLQYIDYTSTREPKSFNKSCDYLEWNFGSIYPDDPLIEIDLRMKVKSSAQCDSVITNLAKYWSDQTDWGQPVSADSQVVCPLAPETGIVINEFLPNPVGYDKAKKPKGEWVELYNKGSGETDVAGWVLYDEKDDNELYIASSNTDTGSTIISAGGFLVVYRNGDCDFALDNTGGDTVRLYDGKIRDGANLIDSYTYAIDALEGKSFARIPDGSDNWVDPIPTPGEPNLIDNENIDFGPALPEEGEEGYEEQSIPEESVESEVPVVPVVEEPENSLAQEIGSSAVEEPALETPSETPQEVPSETPAELPAEPGDELPAIGQPVGGEPLIDEPLIIEEPVVEEEPIIEEEPAEEIPVIEGESIEEEVITEGNQEEGGIIQGIKEIIDEVVDRVVDEINEVIDEVIDEIMPEETISDNESSNENEENIVIDETTVIEETTNPEENAVIEQQSATEEQPVIIPDNNSGGQTANIDNSGSDGGSGNDGSNDGGGIDQGGGSGESVDGGSGVTE